ncbi:MAG TPA: 2-oxoglutarate dehydrogenase, E2 component, dihydrolipoamide succinyltransferase [Candidatus Polarisedimenticolia bacterium]|nr:2-oxoglutarate dehydrogenase, E2 component, dihydrolipoamide succinyltransferase [Candidatus Polarisedimenticolia bacterium]
MRVDVIMPQMGESIAEGTLTRWLRKPGEKVSRDEPIFEISTDKVDAEIPSPAAGVLAEVRVKEGETVPVNTVVAQIETDATAAAGVVPRAAAPAPSTSQPVLRGEPARPAPAPAPARPAASVPAPGAPPRAATAPPGPTPRASALVAGGATAEDLRRVRSSPVVRKIAREHNLDIARIGGTGIGGRVTKRDVLAALESGAGGARAAAPASSSSPAASPAYAPGERVSIVPMTAMRKKIAEHMVMSRRTSAHVATVFEVDMLRVARLREEHQKAFQERHGVKLTVTPFFVKAAVEALKAFPIVNASIDGDNVVYKKDVNIGVAVALDWGLIVPVIKNADDKSLSGIAKAVTDLADRARGKRLTPDEVQGGTFTITNPGIYGALFGTPIINQPQVAIMGVGAINKQPVVVDDAIAIRPIVHLTLSFDHRLIDGAVADQFMAHVKATLQEGRFPEIV